MAGLTKQKQKLLLLKELLERETDDKHSLTVAQIISKLEGMGIKAERKTVYDDIATLQDFGLDVTCQKDGHSNAYAVSSRDFELEELFVLVDAVSSCRFLTIKKSNELIDKIKGLTSKYLSDSLKRSIYIENRPRSTNETVYYNINFIHSAINERKKIRFKYFTYNDKCKEVLKHKEDYIVSPLHLVWENDNYYFIAHSVVNGESVIKTYRVDRMKEVKVINEEIDSLSSDEIQFAKSLRATFSMYGGREEEIVLAVKPNVFNAIIDKFGKGVHFNVSDDDYYTVKLTVNISPTFWGWLFGFGQDAKVVAPKTVVNEAKAQIESIMQGYVK